MALRLQFSTVIVRRADFARCRELPVFMHELNADGGIFLDTSWYDAQLWCETTMDAPDELVDAWMERGLEGPPAGICVAASRSGLVTPCSWLQFDPAENCVWLSGSERGAVVGGMEQCERLSAEMSELEQRAERCYTDMYESRHPKDDFEDATLALHQAGAIARFLHRPSVAERLAQRSQHMQAVYDSQFRAGGPLRR